MAVAAPQRARAAAGLSLALACACGALAAPTTAAAPAVRHVAAVSAATTLSLVPVNYFDGVHIALHAARDVSAAAPRRAHVHTYVELPYPLHLTGPLPAGAVVGQVAVAVGGHTAARAPLVTGQAVPGASAWRRTALDAGHTNPTLALGAIGVVLLAALQLRGLILRRLRGRDRR